MTMLTDLIGGQIQASFDGMSSSIEHIRTGKLRALAVRRGTLEELPNILRPGRFIPNYGASGWCGGVAPRDTSPDIIGTLHNEINAGLASPTIRSRLAELGVTVLAGSIAAFANLIAEETEKCGRVIRATDIRPD
jgi:tripartite-type tricarboxylate transporter receptor subunit TctC